MRENRRQHKAHKRRKEGARERHWRCHLFDNRRMCFKGKQVEFIGGWNHTMWDWHFHPTLIEDWTYNPLWRYLLHTYLQEGMQWSKGKETRPFFFSLGFFVIYISTLWWTSGFTAHQQCLVVLLLYSSWLRYKCCNRLHNLPFSYHIQCLSLWFREGTYHWKTPLDTKSGSRLLDSNHCKRSCLSSAWLWPPSCCGPLLWRLTAIAMLSFQSKWRYLFMFLGIQLVVMALLSREGYQKRVTYFIRIFRKPNSTGLSSHNHTAASILGADVYANLSHLTKAQNHREDMPYCPKDSPLIGEYLYLCFCSCVGRLSVVKLSLGMGVWEMLYNKYFQSSELCRGVFLTPRLSAVPLVVTCRDCLERVSPTNILYVVTSYHGQRLEVTSFRQCIVD